MPAVIRTVAHERCPATHCHLAGGAFALPSADEWRAFGRQHFRRVHLEANETGMTQPLGNPGQAQSKR